MQEKSDSDRGFAGDWLQKRLSYLLPASDFNYPSQHLKIIYLGLVEGLVPSYCYNQLRLQIDLTSVLI